MVKSRITSRANRRRVGGARRQARPSDTDRTRSTVHRAVLEDARQAGLLHGNKSEHFSFRAPVALVEAAKRETGVSSTTELGLLALAMLAQPDPVVTFMKRNRGVLGADHKLEF